VDLFHGSLSCSIDICVYIGARDILFLNTVALQDILTLGIVIPPALSQGLLWLFGFFCGSVQIRIICSSSVNPFSSVKNAVGILIGIALNL